jgi:hypothetical protein
MNHIRPIRAIALAAISALLVLTAALPASARVDKFAGGSGVITTNRTTNVTLRDRTPRAGYVTVLLQKKQGPNKCRVNRIWLTRAGTRYYVGPFEKWARTYNRVGRYHFPNNRRKRDATIQVSIRTNGNCIVGVRIS